MRLASPSMPALSPSSSALGLRSAGLTIAGRRGNNEDAILLEDALGLFAVADGLGGYEAGEVASALAIAELRSFFGALAADRELTHPFSRDPALSPAADALDQAIRLAHRAIVGLRAPSRPVLGSTLAALRLTAGTAPSAMVAHVGHVGDSRVYRLREGAMTQLTRDHSMIEEMRAAGLLENQEIPRHLAHLITRALGLDGWARPTLSEHSVAPGDRFLLCSDGLSGPLDADTLARLLATPSPRVAVEQLVHLALERGSTDNISAVVVALD